MKKVPIESVKRGEYFTVKPIEEPKQSQVYVADGYNRSTGKYTASRFDAVLCTWREWKKGTQVYIDFTF